MEQELNASFYKHFFDSSIELFCAIGQKGNIEKVNKEWERSLAYSQSELEGKPFLAFVHPDDINTTKELFEQVSLTGKAECFHNRLRHKNGVYHWLEWRWVTDGVYMMASASIISERTTIEEDIISNKGLMEDLLRLGKIGVWEIDLVSKKLLLNDSALRIYGYHEIKEDLSSDFLLEHIHPDDFEYAKNVWKETITKAKYSDIEFRIRSKGGELKNILISGNIELGTNKQPIRAYGILQDITRQKEVENNLRASQKILNDAERIAKMGSWQILLSDGTAIWSENLYKIHGMKELPPALEPDWLFSVVHPDDQDKMAKNFQRNIERGFVENDEYRVIHPDGSVHTLNVTGEVIKDVGVSTGHMIGVTQDITERRQAEDKIQRLLSAIDQTTVQIIITDRNYKVEYVNNKFCEVTGHVREELIGHNAEFFSTEENDLGVQTEILTCIDQEEVFKGELLNKNAMGELCWELVSITPIHNSNGELTNYIGIKEDITERKKMEKDILNAKEKAEEANRLKTEFINNLSHEIRTPMNGIIGFSEMLDKPDLSEEKRQYYSKIVQNGSHQLLRIIDDILAISNLETKQDKLNETDFCLNDLLMELFSIFNIQSKGRNIPLYLKKGLQNQHSYIVSDKSKLNIILSNLLENALKFTSEGFIEFGYYLENTNMILYVKDTGIGVSSTNHKIIFERFSQEEKEISYKYGGLGLGLSISKENAQLLGGNLTLESEKGKGSTFYLTIPYKPVQKADDNASKSIDSKQEANDKYEILIAEDEEVNYLYIEALLETEIERDYNLIHAKNGKEAVEICTANNKIDLVLLDIKMPIMNGHEAAEKIKEKFPRLPIIAQTAYSTESDKQLALKHGCDDFISKPINKEKLFELIDKYLKVV